MVLTFRLLDDVDERAALTAATDLDEVFGVGDDVDGGDDGEPVRCLRRANALLSPSVLSCNLCTFTINWLRALDSLSLSLFTLFHSFSPSLFSIGGSIFLYLLALDAIDALPWQYHYICNQG